MKKFVMQALSVLLLLVVCVGVASCSGAGNAPDGMTNMAAADAPFELYIPSGWLSQAESGISGARYSNTDTSNVTVTLYLPDDPYIKAEEYWANHLKPSYEKQFSNFALVEDGSDGRLGGRDGKKYVYTMTWGDVNYQQMQVIVNDGNWVYIFTYTATTDNYATHLEEVDRILAEFRY